MQQYVLCDDFTKSEEINVDPQNKDLLNRFCVHSLNDLYNRFPIKLNMDITKIKDYSVLTLAHPFVRGERKYHGTKELQVKLAEISGFPLPEKFYFIHPWSDNQRYDERDFTLNECRSVIKFLERRKIKGVVINKSNDPWPVESEWVIDLTNKTDMLESIEILKHAHGFVGSASSFSVLASKFVSQENLVIKTPPSILNYWWKFYYAPYRTNEFCHANLEFLG
jgi:hypothetical protein